MTPISYSSQRVHEHPNVRGMESVYLKHGEGERPDIIICVYGANKEIIEKVVNLLKLIR